MHTLYVVSLLFLALLLLIFLNYQYTNRYVQQMIAEADAFSVATTSPQQISDFINTWHRHKRLLSFSVNYRELDRMEELLLMLKFYHGEQNETEVQRTCILIADAARDIVRLEQFNIENIF